MSLLSILADFEDFRYIELQYGLIRIADAEGLRGVLELEDDNPGMNVLRIGAPNAWASRSPRKFEASPADNTCRRLFVSRTIARRATR